MEIIETILNSLIVNMLEKCKVGKIGKLMHFEMQ